MIVAVDPGPHAPGLLVHDPARRGDDPVAPFEDDVGVVARLRGKPVARRPELAEGSAGRGAKRLVERATVHGRHPLGRERRVVIPGSERAMQFCGPDRDATHVVEEMPDPLLHRGRDHEAHVRSWVTASRSAMDIVVWRMVTRWLGESWPFERPLYAPRIAEGA